MQMQNYAILFPLIVFLVLDFILFVNTLKQGLSSEKEKTFFLFLLMASFLQLVTVISYASDLNVIRLPVWTKYVISMLGIELIAITCYMWLEYLILSSPEISIFKSTFFQILLIVPLVLQLVTCISTPWTHWVFYIDNEGVYQGGSVMWLQLLSYVYWIVAFIITIARFITGHERAVTFKRLVLFLFPAAVGGIINTTVFRAGFTQIGFSLGAIMLYLDQYLYEVNENKQLRSVAALNKELITVNEQMKAARDAADRANQAKTKFLFNMSHDIRTPMNAILGYTNIAISHCNEDKVKAYLDKIKNSGQHLLDLINDILEMSRIESDCLKLTEAPMDIRRAISAVSNMSHVLALSKQTEFKVQVGDIQNPYIYADELHLNEVFINLISNAVKYSPKNSCVTYTVFQEAAPVDGKAAFCFKISDNGIGMSEEFQSHLFESFARENDPTVAKEEGTGLGLSIVKNIVGLADGTIEVFSKKNIGTTFTLHISFRILQPDEIEKFEAMTNADSATEKPSSLKGMRILCAEDNEINREICEEILTDAGMHVDFAENGEIAVMKVLEHEHGYYDAVLMDIQMPVMNGYEAAAAIRKLPKGATLPIIALSANAFAEDIQQSKDAGMNAHIAKPIDTAKLFETLEEVRKS